MSRLYCLVATSTVMHNITYIGDERTSLYCIRLINQPTDRPISSLTHSMGVCHSIALQLNSMMTVMLSWDILSSHISLVFSLVTNLSDIMMINLIYSRQCYVMMR